MVICTYVCIVTTLQLLKASEGLTQKNTSSCLYLCLAWILPYAHLVSLLLGTTNITLPVCDSTMVLKGRLVCYNTTCVHMYVYNIAALCCIYVSVENAQCQRGGRSQWILLLSLTTTEYFWPKSLAAGPARLRRIHFPVLKDRLGFFPSSCCTRQLYYGWRVKLRKTGLAS